MKKLLYGTIHKSFPVDKCPYEGIYVETEEDIWNFLVSLRSEIEGTECVPPVAIFINSSTELLVFRGSWVGPEEVGINPFTGKKYSFFTVNSITGKLTGTFNIGTGRIIGLLPDV